MNFLKTAAMFTLVVIIAITMGVALADPMRMQSMGLVAAMVGLLLFPILMRWHGYAFAFSISSGLIVPFVPGKPYLWVALAGATLMIVVLENILQKRKTYRHVPEVVWPLFAFMAVVVLTMMLRGGVGGQAFGSELWGARRYYFIFGAVVAYFAFANLAIPAQRTRIFTLLFFGSGAILVLPDIAFWVGGGLNWIFVIFHEELAAANWASTSEIGRAQGTAAASTALIFATLAVVGFDRLLSPRKWWLLGLLVGVFLVGLLGGFRSAFVVVGVLGLILVHLNRMYLSRRVLSLAVVAGGVLGVMLLFSTSLPLNIQRAISFLPVEVDPLARRDGEGTMLWRIDMWRIAVHEIPNYLWLGKGFTYSGADMQWIENMGQGLAAYEGALIGSWYHSGPLSLIICLGLPGTAAFGWLLTAGFRFLKRQWLQGPEALRTINLFVYAVFIQRTIHFIFFYGQIELDVISFVSLLGFSVALNGGRVRGSAPQRRASSAEATVADGVLVPANTMATVSAGRVR